MKELPFIPIIDLRPEHRKKANIFGMIPSSATEIVGRIRMKAYNEKERFKLLKEWDSLFDNLHGEELEEIQLSQVQEEFENNLKENFPL